MTTTSRRQFGREFKAEAVGLVSSSGKTVAQRPRERTQRRGTLQNWVERA